MHNYIPDQEEALTSFKSTKSIKKTINPPIFTNGWIFFNKYEKKYEKILKRLKIVSKPLFLILWTTYPYK